MTTFNLLTGYVHTFKTEAGDMYIGELVEQQDSRLTLRDYSVWYADEPGPVDAKYADDLITFTGSPLMTITRH